MILISPRTRYPRKRTTFAVVDPQRLSVRRLIHLRGDFSFDAISPDGSLIYLIKYDPRNLTRYEVRAYNMHVQNLVADPVVDPNEPEPMSGVPVTRTSSLDGRWAYTLYDSPEHPFVHALDTARRTAVCIDLDDLPRAWGSSLELHGPRLDVVGPAGRIRATIDTRTHKLVRDHPAPVAEDDAGTSWLPIAGPTAALLLVVDRTGAAASRQRASSGARPVCDEARVEAAAGRAAGGPCRNRPSQRAAHKAPLPHRPDAIDGVRPQQGPRSSRGGRRTPLPSGTRCLRPGPGPAPGQAMCAWKASTTLPPADPTCASTVPPLSNVPIQVPSVMRAPGAHGARPSGASSAATRTPSAVEPAQVRSAPSSCGCAAGRCTRPKILWSYTSNASSRGR